MNLTVTYSSFMFQYVLNVSLSVCVYSCRDDDACVNCKNFYRVIMYKIECTKLKKLTSSKIKWGASSRWLSSLYCRMRNLGEMTIRKTHPTLSLLTLSYEQQDGRGIGQNDVELLLHRAQFLFLLFQHESQ